jgi:hypothetical protein
MCSSVSTRIAFGAFIENGILNNYSETTYAVSRGFSRLRRVNLLRQTYEIVGTIAAAHVEKLWKTRGHYGNLRVL